MINLAYKNLTEKEKEVFALEEMKGINIFEILDEINADEQLRAEAENTEVRLEIISEILSLKRAKKPSKLLRVEDLWLNEMKLNENTIKN